MKSDDFVIRKDFNPPLNSERVKLLPIQNLSKAESVRKLKKLNGFISQRALASLKILSG